jgi:hypothetical protein
MRRAAQPAFCYAKDREGVMPQTVRAHSQRAVRRRLMLRQIQSPAHDFVAMLANEVQRCLQPLLASRAEVQRLSRRIRDLEQHLKPLPARRVLTTREYAELFWDEA